MPSDDISTNIKRLTKRNRINFQFDTGKAGDVDISNAYRVRIERELDGLQAEAIRINEINKPPPPPPPPRDDGRNGVERFFHRTFGW